MGFRGRLTRTNLAYANEKRDWRVFAAVAEVLIRRARKLYQDDLTTGQLPEVAFALDASIIHLSVKLFPWAYWGRSKAGALKLHTLLSLQGNIPTWALITDASFQEMKTLDEIPVQRGAFYVMDRGYLDFTRLIRLENEGAWFVVRNKRHVRFHVVESKAVDKQNGMRCDQIIRLVTPWSRKSYAKHLRRIRFRDAEQDVHLSFLPIILKWNLKSSAISINAVGRWNFSSNGSNSIYVSGTFLAAHETQSIAKSGPPSAPTCS